MEDVELDNILKNFKNVSSCDHNWDFLITTMEKSNLFVENCSKCSYNINTLEIFEN